MSQTKLTVLVVFLIFALIAYLTLVFRTTIFFGQASVKNSSPVALENSYLFASPLQAKADGKEQIRITVFLLDNRGLGVPDLTVSLNSAPPIVTTNTQAITDDTGKAVFDLSSTKNTKTEIQASVNNRLLPQKVKVFFY